MLQEVGAPFQHAAALLTQFSTTVQDRTVDAAELLTFLEAVAAEHGLVNLDAANISVQLVSEQFATAHTVATADMADLHASGMGRAHAKVVFKYLGGRAHVHVQPVHQAYNMEQIPTTGPMQATQMAFAFAGALESAKDVAVLSPTDPTVYAVRQWARKHADMANKIAAPLAAQIRALRTDINMDVAAALTDAAVAAADSSYAPKVLSSITEDHQDEYLDGAGVDDSALGMLQTMLKAAVNVDDDDYDQLRQEMKGIGVTHEAHMMKSRYDMLKKKLTEIRYHPRFKLKDAIKALVNLCQPDAYLAQEVMAMWAASAKAQVDLTKLMAHVKKETKKASKTQQTSRPAGNSNKLKAGGSYSGSGNSSNNTNTNSATRRNTNGTRSNKRDTPQICRDFTRTGECRFGDRCRFEHEGTSGKSVNHVVKAQFKKEFKQLKQMQDDFQKQMLEQAQANSQYAVNNMFADLASDSSDSSSDSDGGDNMQHHLVNWTKKRAQVPLRRARKELRNKQRKESLASRCESKCPEFVIDGATEIDVLAGRDRGKADSITELDEPVQYTSVGGSGVATQGASSSTPVVSVKQAIVIPGAKSSLVGHKSIFESGIDAIVYTSTECALVKGEEVHSAVPKGTMYTLPTSSEPKKIDAAMSKAIRIAQEHAKRVAIRRIKRHMKRMHQPKAPKGSCRTCDESLTAKPSSTRGDPRAERTGSERGLVVGIDYIVGLPMSKNGHNAVLVMAVAGKARMVAAVPCVDRSGEIAVASFKEAASRVLRAFPLGTQIARVHSDQEKSLIGKALKEHLGPGVWSTSTEGYDHNANATVESVTKQLTRTLRASLLECTGGRGRYQEVWDDLYEHAADVFNNVDRSDGVSPVAAAGSTPTDIDSDSFLVFGQEVLKFTSHERKDGKLDMPTRWCYWAGRSGKIANGHKVVGIEWNDRTKSYDFGPTEHVADVISAELVFPMRLMPKQNGSVQDLSNFVDRFDPGSVSDDTFQVKEIVDHRYVAAPGKRSKKKTLEFLVHWKGYSKREATWEPKSHLDDCKELLLKYNTKHKLVNHVVHATDDMLAAVQLMQRHKLDCSLQTAMEAYNLELNTVEGLRMEELHGEERERVLKENKVPRLRMNPEPKPDRLKMRLIVRGDTEPKHLYAGQPIDSPTPMASSKRLMIALQDEGDEPEELAVGDVGTAFLKGDEYKPHEPKRYVAYKAHKTARLRVFRLRGSLYGQVDASMRWFVSIKNWMVNDQGFVQSKNDVCLFRHPTTKLKVLIHVDDNMSRGSRACTAEFWEAMDKRFGLKHWSFIESGEQKRFLGVNIFKDMMGGKRVFGVHQNDDVAAFVDEHMAPGVQTVKSPMPDKHAMYKDMTPLGDKAAKQFRSLLMSLSWFGQETRLDIVTAVNVLAQMSSKPVVSGLQSLHRVIRYIAGRTDFTLYSVRTEAGSSDIWEFWVDSDLAGDPSHTRSRTGAVACANSMPVYWRSNKQPITCFSSGAAEIFAFSEALKDARLLVWRAEDLGKSFKYPITIKEDNAAAVSFQQSTTPSSKLRGVYNCRDKWVQELKDIKIVRAEKVPTDLNAADMFTKCHQWHSMKKLLNLLYCLHEPVLQFRGH